MNFKTFDNKTNIRMNLNWERGKKMTVTGRIIGTGSYVPERIVTNEDLAKLVETSDEWIVTRTGIHERRIAVEEGTSAMASRAAERALENAGIKAEELDII